jgi:hypothetical protein
MELFRSLRVRTGRNILKKKALKVKRKRGFVNLAEVRTIGVVWDITQTDDLAPISDFILRMNERGIKVDALAVFQGKLLPDKLTALRYINCLKREDLSFFYTPNTSDTEKFMQTSYDLLIEITFRDCLPVQYISTLTPATCRVSTDTGKPVQRDYADIMIGTGMGCDVKEYLNQTVKYLEIINKAIV